MNCLATNSKPVVLPFTTNDSEVCIRRITNGNLVLILMRGVPGSGKSTMARKIISATVDPNRRGVVCSTDDYFIDGTGNYVFDPSCLDAAHKWNFDRVSQALQKRYSPVIVDNTNCQIWEMTNYVLKALECGYGDVHFIEPDTYWKFKPGALAVKNCHGVDRAGILRMLEKYDYNVSLSTFVPQIKQRFGDKFILPIVEPSPISAQRRLESDVRENSQFGVAHLSSHNPLHDELWKTPSASELADLELPKRAPVQNEWGTSENALNDVWAQPESPLVGSSAVSSGINSSAGELNLETVQVESTHEEHAKADDLLKQSTPNQDASRSCCTLRHAGVTDSTVLTDGSTVCSKEQLHCDIAVDAVPNGSRKLPPSSRKKIGSRLLADLDASGSWKLPDFLLKKDVVCEPSNILPKDCDQIAFVDVVTQSSQTNAATGHLNTDAATKMKEADVSASFTATYQRARNVCVAHCSMQTDDSFVGSMPWWSSNDDEQHSIAILRETFPQASLDHLHSILETCGFSVEAALNQLMDAGFGCEEQSVQVQLDSNSAEPYNDSGLIRAGINASCGTAAALPPQADSSWLREELGIAALPDDECFGSDADSASLSPYNYAETCETGSVCNSDDQSEAGFVCLELGCEMASDLQRLFGAVLEDDCPTEFASPSQLRISLPIDLAEALHKHWQKSYCAASFASASDAGCDVMVVKSEDDDFSDQLPEECENDAELARLLQESESADLQVRQASPSTTVRVVSLRQVMAEELAAERGQRSVKKHGPVFKGKISLANRLKLQRLQEMFGNVDLNVLHSTLEAHAYHMEACVESIAENFTSVPVQNFPSWPNNALPDETDGESFNCPSEEQIWDQFRNIANQHHRQSVENFAKARWHYQRGNKDVAFYYAQEGHNHRRLLKEANKKAAERILLARRMTMPPDVIDLHGLFVPEAVAALAEILSFQKRRLDNGGSITVITGSGKHSRGGKPRLKPAVEAFLKNRKYRITEPNAGVLQVSLP